MGKQDKNRREFIKLLGLSSLGFSLLGLASCSNKMISSMEKKIQTYFPEDLSEEYLEKYINDFYSDKFQNSLFTINPLVETFFDESYKNIDNKKDLLKNLRLGEYVIPNEVLESFYFAIRDKGPKLAAYLSLRESLHKKKDIKKFKIIMPTQFKKDFFNYFHVLRQSDIIILSESTLSDGIFEKDLPNLRLIKDYINLESFNSGLSRIVYLASEEMQINHLVEFKDKKVKKVRLNYIDFYGLLYAGQFTNKTEETFNSNFSFASKIYQKIKSHSDLK